MTTCNRLHRYSRASHVLAPCLGRRCTRKFAIVVHQNAIPERPSSRAPAAILSWPVLLCAGTAAAYSNPTLFTGFHVDANITLGIALFSIASTTNFSAVRKAVWRPSFPFGLVIGFSVFPLLCLLAASLGNWAPSTMLGLAVLGACPPGTASNMVGTHVAQADVALATALSAVSTLCGVAFFPLMFAVITNVAPVAAAMVPVLDTAHVTSIFLSHTLQGVLLPILAGLTFASLLPGLANRTRPFAPFLGAAMILTTVSNKTAQNAPLLSSTPLSLIMAVVAIHAAAFAIGYLIAKVLGCPEEVCRTCSLQASDRNPALGAVVVLSMLVDPAVVVPCIVGVFAQNIIGSTLAIYWGLTGTHGSA